MNWPIEECNIQELFLDSKNIRIPITLGNQNALIQDLFMNEDAFEIAKSIMHYGLFPDEFPIITKENSKLIVIEGNRRLAALKALNNPDIVPAFQSKLTSIKKRNIATVKVVIAPSRENATTLIANKHTINLRKPWKPLRQAYFYKSQMDNGKSIEQLIIDFPEVDILKFIRMLDMHKLAKSIKYEDKEIESVVHNDRKFPISTLERMYGDPNIRNFLGIDFNDKGEVVGKIQFNEFQKGFKVVVEDVASGDIDSRKYNSGAQREDYLRKFPADKIPDKTKKGSFTAKKVKEQIPTTPTNNGKKDSSNKIPKGLFSSTHVPFKISNSSLRIMYNELHELPVSKFPNAAHDLLRSFLECSLIFFLKEKGEYTKVQKNSAHNPSLSEMLTHLTSKNCQLIKDPNLIQTINQVKSQYSEKYSLERMNMINHNENWISTEKDVRTAWAKLEPLIKLFINPKI